MDHFFKSLGIIENTAANLNKVAKALGIPLKKLKFYNEKNILPDKEELEVIKSVLKIPSEIIMLKMGIFDRNILQYLSKNADQILMNYNEKTVNEVPQLDVKFKSEYGSLYEGDCIQLMKKMPTNSVDLIFADPPFNLDKFYKSEMDDNLSPSEYIKWSEEWIDECIRILKDGGSFFFWNLPKWNTYFAKYLNDRLTFRNWIATDIKFSLPITGRLYPSHYSLLYYIKGEKPNTFKPDRLPIDVCKNCYKEIKDYGGYKDKMNPKGINLTDVWFDIPPVRHAKYKKRKEANELSVKLLDRIIEMSSKEGDLIFDPFGGSGTSYIVAELKKRNWIGVELGSTVDIIDRFKNISDEKEYLNSFREDLNILFTDKIKKARRKKGLWTDDTFKLTEGGPPLLF